MKRWMWLLYGSGSYALFLATLVYGVAFFGNLVVGRTIDAAPTVPLGAALFVNTMLLVAFALQHSGMARPRFKRWLSACVDPAAERSTYVLVSSAALIGLMILWQPMGWVVWSVDHALARYLVLGTYFFGWALMVWATFLIDHWELFGLRQVRDAFLGNVPCRPPGFRTPSAYRYVRHPIYTGWLIVLWAAPTMTLSRLVLATGLTAYVIVGARLEERDLEQRMPYYGQYRRKVPMLVPSWRRRLVAETESRGPSPTGR